MEKALPGAHLALVFLIVLVWGFNFVVIQVGLDGFPPIFLCFARFFLTCFPAIFFIKRPQVPFKRVASYGLVLFALSFSLLFMGMYAGVPPGLTAVLLQTQVFFTILFAILCFGEKLHKWQILGALISFAGISIVIKNLGGGVTWQGLLLVIAAGAAWGGGNIISKKMGKVNMMGVVVWASLVAWPPLLLVSYLVEGGDKILYSLQHVNWLSVSAVLYITYISTLFAFSAWSWLIHHHPISTIVPFTLLAPIVGILSSVALLDEPLPVWKFLAALLVIAGLCINYLGPRLRLLRNS